MTTPFIQYNKLSLILICLIILGSGCASYKTKTNTTTTSLKNTHTIQAVNLKTLESLATISTKLARHRVIFVGENHTNYGDHLNQLAVIKQLHQHWGNKTTIGLEMIQQPYQRYLNQYIAGQITEKQMLKKTEWYKRWKYEFRLYRPIFNYAKQNKIALVALNIPTEVTHKISKVGIKKLATQDRAFLPSIIDRSNKAYLKRLSAVFAQHFHTRSKGIKLFIDAQLGWDEGMAFAATKYLQAQPAKNMIILAGSGHVINYAGIPDRLDRQLKTQSAVILNNVTGKMNKGSGNYALLRSTKSLPPIGYFGITMKPANSKGVLISKVLNNSAAKKAGLRKGDLIIRLNNHIIQDDTDFRLFSETTQPNENVVITIRRGNKRQSLNLLLQKKPNRFIMP